MMKSIEPILLRVQKATSDLRCGADKQLSGVLRTLADLLESNRAVILRANARDLGHQKEKDPKNDRLMLDEHRIRSMAEALRKVSGLPDPAGKVLDRRTLANGLEVERITVPFGVIGAIYESRPNVTFDIAALCIRSRNGCVLKGSREAAETNKAAIGLIRKALTENGLSPDCVALLPSDRESVQQLMKAVRLVDLLIPRGSEGLIRHVRTNSLVPVIETGAGVCHVYVEAEADLEMATRIVVNAKVSRPSVCNAMDTLLVDREVAPALLKRLEGPLGEHGVEIFADREGMRLLKGYRHLQRASPDDYDREFLSLRCAIKIVGGMEEAMEHIRVHSTRHSEAIISRNESKCERFIRDVDAAAVYANASTRFTDGEELGLGAEIGISTQKLHARGPFALEKLVTEKWIMRGTGQVRG
jgi:glutamate-5-semialdehyde dehydrogenase